MGAHRHLRSRPVVRTGEGALHPRPTGTLTVGRNVHRSLVYSTDGPCRTLRDTKTSHDPCSNP